jgi:hypothetical protein
MLNNIRVSGPSMCRDQEVTSESGVFPYSLQLNVADTPGVDSLHHSYRLPASTLLTAVGSCEATFSRESLSCNDLMHILLYFIVMGD